MKKNITDIVLIVMVIIWIMSNGLLHARLNTINTKLDNIDIKITSEEKDEDKELYLCPYCNNGLYIFSSSFQTSVAQMRCHYCGFKSPEVHINKPNAELECIKKCKENFKNDIWIDEDFTGEVD